MLDTYLQTLRRFDPNVRLFLLSAALIGFTASSGIQAVLMNLYLLRLGYGLEFVGQINAIGGLTFALFSMPVAILCRRWGSRRMMIVGIALITTGSALLPLIEFAPVAWWTPALLASRLPNAIGFALYVVSASPFLMAATSGRERTHVFSVQIAMWPLAGFAGGLVGGLLPEFFAAILDLSMDSPAPFRYSLFLSALVLSPGVVALMATRESVVDEEPEGGPDPVPAPIGPLVFTFMVLLFQTACVGVVHTFLNVYLDAELRVSTALIGAILATGALVSGIATLATPLLSARLGHVRVVLLGSLGTVVGLLPLVLLAHWGAAGLGFVAMIALASLRSPAMMVYQQEMVPQRWRPLMSGAANMASGLSFAAASLGGGYLIPMLGYRSLSLASMGSMLLGTLIFWGYFRTPRGEYARGGLSPSSP